MNLFHNYYFYNYNSIVISKSLIYSLTDFPQIKSLSLFFIINTKLYKKNFLLFCIVVSLMIGVIPNFQVKQKNVKTIQTFNFFLTEHQIFNFFWHFILVYLPILNTNENSEKRGIISLDSLNKKERCDVYRLDYFSFPVLFQLDLLCSNFEILQNFISKYKLRLDTHIKSNCIGSQSYEYLLRMYRLPCYFLFKLNK